MFWQRGSKQNYYWWPENWPMFLFLVALNFLVLALIVKRLPPPPLSSLCTAIFSPFRTSCSNQITKRLNQKEREEKAEIRWASIHQHLAMWHLAPKTQIMLVTGHASLFLQQKQNIEISLCCLLCSTIKINDKV